MEGVPAVHAVSAVELVPRGVVRAAPSAAAGGRGRLVAAGAGAAAALLLVAGPAWAGALAARAGRLAERRPDRVAVHGGAGARRRSCSSAWSCALVYALRRYRERRSPVAAQVRGNHRLEIGWTVAAAGLIVVLAVFSLTKLRRDRSPRSRRGQPRGGQRGHRAGRRRPSHCTSRSWVASTSGCTATPGGAYSYEEMVAPVGVTVKLDIVSLDVAHSWWIPKLGGKFDAIPGYVNHTWFRLERPGVYRGQCAELCGRNHADMVAQVRGVSPGRVRRVAEAAEAIDPGRRRGRPQAPAPRCGADRSAMSAIEQTTGTRMPPAGPQITADRARAARRARLGGLGQRPPITSASGSST